MKRVLVVFCAAASALFSAGALAQAWPTKPLRMIIPYPPGGATDILGRLISQKLSPMLGQPVLVENKAGASGNLAFDFVAKSAPDEFMTRIRADVAKFSALVKSSGIKGE